jgi:hypothetical protein
MSLIKFFTIPRFWNYTIIIIIIIIIITYARNNSFLYWEMWAG